MAQQPIPQPPVVGPLASDGSIASPEGIASAKAKPKTSPDRERRSFATEDAEKPYQGGPAGPDGDDDPDDRGSEYCPDDSSAPVKP